MNVECPQQYYHVDSADLGIVKVNKSLIAKLSQAIQFRHRRIICFEEKFSDPFYLQSSIRETLDNPREVRSSGLAHELIFERKFNHRVAVRKFHSTESSVNLSLTPSEWRKIEHDRWHLFGDCDDFVFCVLVDPVIHEITGLGIPTCLVKRERRWWAIDCYLGIEEKYSQDLGIEELCESPDLDN